MLSWFDTGFLGVNVDHQFSGAPEPAFFLAAGFRGRAVIFRAMRRFRPAAIYSRIVAEAGAGAFSASVGAAGLARKFARLRRRWFLFAGCFFYRVGATAADFVESPRWTFHRCFARCFHGRLWRILGGRTDFGFRLVSLRFRRLPGVWRLDDEAEGGCGCRVRGKGGVWVEYRRRATPGRRATVFDDAGGGGGRPFRASFGGRDSALSCLAGARLRSVCPYRCP